LEVSSYEGLQGECESKGGSLPSMQELRA
jgi:hypothetical protein